MNKYNSKSSLCRMGHSHRSKLEASVCALIQLRVKAGELEFIKAEDRIVLGGCVTYICDFKCQDVKTGKLIFIEAKGLEMSRWPTIVKAWKLYGPGTLEVWKGTAARPILYKTIIPNRDEQPFCESCGR